MSPGLEEVAEHRVLGGGGQLGHDVPPLRVDVEVMDRRAVPLVGAVVGCRDQGRDLRRAQQWVERRRPRFSEPMLTIHQRPFSPDDRSEVGHWEET